MPLGLFQFENLLKSRVQFYVFAWADLAVLGMKGMEKMHLERIVIPMHGAVSLSDVKSQITERKLDTNAPIVLIDQDGIASREIAQALDEEGFLNVFWALDGVDGFMIEKSGV